jgi:Na+/H+ antiporter NhaD/arsenite permease-like protein
VSRSADGYNHSVVHTLDVHPLWLIPFAALLASISTLPLVATHFWESNRNKAYVTFALALPVAAWLCIEAPDQLVHSLTEYVSFVCLTGALFVVAGGIHVCGDLRATPRVNVTLMAIGAILANLIGTTGASVVMIRLLLRTNSERQNTQHIPFFFVVLVSNVGGMLTPLGDPPLFLGYLRGVPFFWTLKLFPIWLLGVSYLLAALYVVDRRAYATESRVALVDDTQRVEPVRVLGWANVGLLLCVVGTVFLSAPIREVAMVALAAVSFFVGSREARRKNEFSFSPIVEVAILFAGIFVAMVPALLLLREHAPALGFSAPWQFFVATGVLSSILDNAPTYLAFLATAQGLRLPAEVVGIPHAHLLAISAGAVLMGANTYIGNGPNFMVKTIADSQGYKTDSFGLYAVKAVLLLAPIYVVVALYLGGA